MEQETKQILIEDIEDSNSSMPTQPKGNLLKFYLNIFKRKWSIILGCTILGFLPAYLLTLRGRPYYAGNFEMLIEPITSEEQLTDPSVLARLGTNANPNIFGVDYPTIIKILKGREMLEKVASRVSKQYPQYPKNYLLSTFRENLVVERSKSGKSRFDVTKVIFVRYQGIEPSIVLATLNTLADEYLKYSEEQRKNNLESGVSFIDQQLPTIKLRIEQSREQQKELQRKYELIQPLTKGESLSQINTQRKQEIQVLATQLQELTLLSDKLQQDLGLTPEEALAATTLSQDPERQSLLNQLQQIESQLALESALLTPNHPQILNLREQKNNLENLLEEENRRTLIENNISLNINPRVFVNQDANRLGLIQKLVETQNQLETLSSRYESLSRNQRQTLEELATMPTVIKDFNNLQRQIELDTNILNQLTSQKEALSVDAAQKEVPWEILAEPSIPVNVQGQLVSTPPDPKKKLVAGIGGGLILGLLAAIAIERRRDVYYEASDLEYAFGLPILGTLPMSDKSRKKQSLDDEDSFFTEPSSSSILNEFIDHTSPFISEIYTNLHFRLPHSEEKQYILVSSLNPADGQGYFCSSLTKTATKVDQKVLIIDGNPLEEEMSTYFDDSHARRTNNFGEYVHRGLKEILPATVLSDISIVTAGGEKSDLPLNMGAEETQSAIKSIAKDYTLILYNTSFFLESHELSLLAEKTQGILMVVKLEQTPHSSLTQAVKRIQHYNLNFLGFVVVE